jgi:hypothetical protein
MSKRSRTRFIGATTLAGLILFAAGSSGDPVLITTGGVTMVSPIEGQDPPFGFTIGGADLSFQASFFDLVGVAGQAGSLMNLNGGIAIRNPPFQTSSVIVNGTTFSGIYPGGGLTFTAAPIPLGPGTDLATFHFTTPFTMTGTLEGFSDSQRRTAPLFDVDVSGSGTASVTGIVHGNGAGATYLGQIVGYSFAPASPTPEPSPLALCGMAGAALLLWRARRHPLRRRSA